MKKVLFVATVVKTHIMEFHIPYLKMFQDMGWKTAVAARNDYEDPADCKIPFCDTYYDIPFERLPWKAANIKAYRELKAIIDREHFDIIHCHTPVGAMIARLAARDARKRGTKVIYTAHGFHFFKGAPVKNWLMFYPAEWLLAPLTDVLVTINKEDYALAKRRELGLTEQDFLILTVAEMTKNKNHSTVLKALALLKNEPGYESMHYLICGRGEQRDALEAEARQLGIWEHVHFLGYRHDVPELCRCSDIFAFMSFREGMPVALMEAMSCGLPAVCSKIRGNTDLIEHGVDGLFAENTPEGVAAAILKLYHDPALREQLGRAASQTVSRFDAKAVQQRMKEIYLSV